MDGTVEGEHDEEGVGEERGGEGGRGDGWLTMTELPVCTCLQTQIDSTAQQEARLVHTSSLHSGQDQTENKPG